MKKILIKFRYTILLIAKLFLLALPVMLMTATYFEKYEEAHFYFKGNILAILTYTALLFVFIRMFGGFEIGYLRKNELSYSIVEASFFADGAFYVVLCLISQKLLSPIPMLFCYLIQIAAGITMARLFNKLYFFLYPARNAALICHDRDDAHAVINKIKFIKERYILRCVLPDSLEYEQIIKVIKNFESVMFYEVKDEYRNKLLEYCYSEGKRVYIVPTIQDLIIANGHLTQIFDTTAILCKNKGLTEEERIIKRGFDFIISLVGIIILSPVMLIVGLLIKAQDKGPAFFKQERLTENGKVFTLIKFRSMKVNAESDGKARLATADDDRITPLGKVLRASRLDEIPQLINILKGDMSLVGPRPERPEIAAEYEKQYPDFKYRLKMKAGLTGNAQVNGKYDTSPQDKLLLDLAYIQRFSLLNDIKLLFKTFKVIFMPDSAEGFSKEKTDVSQIEFIEKE